MGTLKVHQETFGHGNKIINLLGFDCFYLGLLGSQSYGNSIVGDFEPNKSIGDFKIIVSKFLSGVCALNKCEL